MARSDSWPLAALEKESPPLDDSKVAAAAVCPIWGHFITGEGKRNGDSSAQKVLLPLNMENVNVGTWAGMALGRWQEGVEGTKGGGYDLARSAVECGGIKSVRSRETGVACLLKAMEQPFGPLPLEEKMPERGAPPRSPQCDNVEIQIPDTSGKKIHLYITSYWLVFSFTWKRMGRWAKPF